ncbi:SdrD B-like domain-containing protein [Amycolatopsis sp. YIM 10]|uniref:SdrD B-like domain-containing protein n=1 Tax=Amycolatopsis sp. YIM 10 TaxID=2653857 RepID=UPI00128FF4E8|nr:SdrD B-like domain-containing protein [Amycolatopsis sp. YIM 10]QFU94266.1 Serine-aspartate repeat-containing protein C precursor [Amycolatopsis sp. YIM 10]
MNSRRWRRWVVLGVLAALACLLTSCGGVARAATTHFVGDYVWLDTDRNGLQDPGEPPVEGVRATLFDGAGTAVETTRSGENGRYLFGDLPDGAYHVCFDLDALPAQVGDHRLTAMNAGNDAVDSDVDPETGCTRPALTSTDLTLDAGLTAPGNELGDYAWLDQDGDGLQSPEEPPVEGVRVALHHGDGTPTGIAVTTGPDGRYAFSNLPDGSYLVCFDLDGRQATVPAAGDEALDSDADPVTGCTGAVTAGLGARQDLTLDLGLLPAPGTPAVSP